MNKTPRTSDRKLLPSSAAHRRDLCRHPATRPGPAKGLYLSKGLVGALVVSLTTGFQPVIGGDLAVSGFSLGDEIATVRVEQFRTANPEVSLNVTEGAFDPQQFLTAVASRNVPDVVYLNRDDLSTYATRGAIVPLDACVADQEVDLTQFREAALGQVTVGDELYGIPEFYNVVAVIAADRAFKAAGLEPTDLRTSDWDALARVNEQLTEGTGDTLTRIGFDPKLPEFFPLWVRANGGALLSDDGRTATLATPEAVEALTYTAGLHEAAGGRQAFSAFRDTWDFFGADNQIATDQLAAFPMEQWYLNVLAEVSPETPITVSAFLDREGTPFTFATGSAWAIPRGAANPDAACAFMKTMTAPETWVAAAQARAEARTAEGLPFAGVYTANRVADERIFGEVVEPSGNAAFDSALEVVLDVQDNAFAIPANPAGAEFRQAWTDAVNRVLNGEQDAQAALEQAQTEAQAALDDAWDE